MNCSDYQPCITAYASSDLSPEESRALENHLEQCARCREELAAALSLEEALVGQPLSPPPVDMAERIMVSLEQRQAQSLAFISPSSAHEKRITFFQRDVLPVAAFSFLTIFAGFYIHHIWTPLIDILTGLKHFAIFTPDIWTPATEFITGLKQADIMTSMIDFWRPKGEGVTEFYIELLVTVVFLLFGLIMALDLSLPNRINVREKLEMLRF